ncbi:MAG TPA: hypothetical protein PK006_12295 [Saprospiraceae bacterium]|nr:hypothetical protein [Saprospiraceae bacterium]
MKLNLSSNNWILLLTLEVDTHTGSGSSRIACEKARFDFTGFEIEKEYFLKQEKRFAMHLSMPRLPGM